MGVKIEPKMENDIQNIHWNVDMQHKILVAVIYIEKDITPFLILPIHLLRLGRQCEEVMQYYVIIW